MSAASSWCTLLLRTKALQQTQFKVHAPLTITHGAFRSLSSTAIRRAARPTPAIAPEVPADAKEGKETTQEPTARKPVDALPFLSRPLGIRDRPSTIARSWQEEMMDQDTRMANRKKLVKAATKGYFADLSATRRYGGKTWVAPPVLIREDKALYLPNISGTPLDRSETAHTTDLCLGKVSVISILSSKISEIQCKMFVESALNEFKDNAHFQYIQINLQENPLKSMLVSFFASSIKKTLPKDQWSRYLISSQNMDYIRDELALENKHIAYVYLVDTACRIRWAACGDPQPGEIDSLRQCVSVLLKRLAP